MIGLHEPIHGWLATAGEPILRHLAGSTLFLTLALLAARFIPRLSARSRFFIVLAGMLKFAIPAELLHPLLRMTGIGASGGDAPIEGGLTSVFYFSDVVVSQIAPAATSEILCTAALIWLAGALLVGGWWTAVHVRSSALLRSMTEPPSERELKLLESVTGGGARTIPVARSAILSGPAVVGIHRPLILMPRGISDALDDAELRSVFAHELSHIARRDNLLATIQRILCTIFWFHPLVWLGERRTAVEREHACDERTVAAIGDPESYLSAILKICHQGAAPRLTAVSCMGGHLSKRSDTIMKQLTSGPRHLSHRVAAAITIFCLAAVVVGSSIASAGEGALRPSASDSASTLFRFDVKADRTSNGVLFSVIVRELSTGTVISAPKVMTQEGQPALVVSGNQAADGTGREIRVEITFDTDGTPRAVMTVHSSDGQLIERQERSVPIGDSAAVEGRMLTAPPIDLTLKNARLSDVVRTFGELTNRKISTTESLEGQVTINESGVPWDEMLARVLAPHGLTFTYSADTIYIVRLASGTADDPARVGQSGVVPPKLITRVDPVYSPEGRAARVAGLVIVEAVIDESGRVRDTTVIKGLPFDLDKAAEEAVRQWVFEPALRNGKPIAVKYTFTVSFRPDPAR